MKLLTASTTPTAARRCERRTINVASRVDARELGICVVFQDFRLVPALSVVENVALALLGGRGLVCAGPKCPARHQRNLGRSAQGASPDRGRMGGRFGLGVDPRVRSRGDDRLSLNSLDHRAYDSFTTRASSPAVWSDPYVTTIPTPNHKKCVRHSTSRRDTVPQ